MSAAAFTNKRRVTAIAQGTKVQYTNHKVSVDNLRNSVLPCLPRLQQIVYIPNPPCGCPPLIIITLIDGGFPGDQYPVLDGGFPGSSGRIIDCGVI
jgi:hypothetical protein